MKKLIASMVVFLLLLSGYEIAFRCCTAQWGEINTDTDPICLYYSCDLMLGHKLLQTIFAPRAALQLGKVRLAKGTGAHISGNTFYRKLQNGNWQDVTAGVKDRKDRE
ncbi:MAG: hypothetical protein WC708_08200 [Lentisphaeria bacterium]